MGNWGGADCVADNFLPERYFAITLCFVFCKDVIIEPLRTSFWASLTDTGSQEPFFTCFCESDVNQGHIFLVDVSDSFIFLFWGRRGPSRWLGGLGYIDNRGRGEVLSKEEAGHWRREDVCGERGGEIIIRAEISAKFWIANMLGLMVFLRTPSTMTSVRHDWLPLTLWLLVCSHYLTALSFAITLGGHNGEQITSQRWAKGKTDMESRPQLEKRKAKNGTLAVFWTLGHNFRPSFMSGGEGLNHIFQVSHGWHLDRSPLPGSSLSLAN